jgi:hypothetical protein
LLEDKEDRLAKLVHLVNNPKVFVKGCQWDVLANGYGIIIEILVETGNPGEMVEYQERMAFENDIKLMKILEVIARSTQRCMDQEKHIQALPIGKE